MAQTELSCRPCLSHVRHEPQITQDFRRLLRLPLSKRVDQKEVRARLPGNHKYAKLAPCCPPRTSHQEEDRTRQNHSLPRSSKKKPVAPLSLPTKSAPSGNPCCRLCHNQRRRRVPVPVVRQQLLPVRTLLRVKSAPRRHHWHRPTRYEPLDQRSAWTRTLLHTELPGLLGQGKVRKTP